MNGIIIPNAQVIFDSVGSIIDETGINDFQPETDEEWEEVADRALGLAEAANLLLMPERSEGREVWIETSLMMSERAVRTSETALLRDPAALLEAGGELYEACEACHLEYIVDETAFYALTDEAVSSWGETCRVPRLGFTFDCLHSPFGTG